MKIYVNGCSHTAGHCVDEAHTWPQMLARPIKNCKLTNDSKVGASNDYIFHKSLETITELISSNKKPDLVIIQWSSPNRRTHCMPDEKIVFVNPADYTEYHLKFEPMGSMHTLHYMFCMQEFLKNNDINYLFFNYMDLDKSIKKLSIYNMIDWDKFLKFDIGDDIIFKGMMDYMMDNKMNCFKEDGHPNKLGNSYITKHIIKKLGITSLYSL